MSNRARAVSLSLWPIGMLEVLLLQRSPVLGSSSHPYEGSDYAAIVRFLNLEPRRKTTTVLDCVMRGLSHNADVSSGVLDPSSALPETGSP